MRSFIRPSLSSSQVIKTVADLKCCSISTNSQVIWRTVIRSWRADESSALSLLVYQASTNLLNQCPSAAPLSLLPFLISSVSHPDEERRVQIPSLMVERLVHSRCTQEARGKLIFLHGCPYQWRQASTSWGHFKREASERCSELFPEGSSFSLPGSLRLAFVETSLDPVSWGWYWGLLSSQENLPSSASTQAAQACPKGNE